MTEPLIRQTSINPLLTEVQDQDFYALQNHLNTKLLLWLAKMDWYVRERNPANTQELYEFCQFIFAPRFYYGMVGANGHGAEALNDLWDSRKYDLKEWAWAQGVEQMQALIKKGAFVAAPRPHHLEVIEPGKKVRLVGYHDHIYWGDFALLLGTSHQIAWETIIFEKIGAAWLITHYEEVVYDASPPLINKKNLWFGVLTLGFLVSAIVFAVSVLRRLSRLS